MKKLILIAVLFLAAGCDPTTKEIREDYQLPEGLKDCKVYKMESMSRDLFVVRCPNSTTSVANHHNKHTYYNSTISQEQ